MRNKILLFLLAYIGISQIAAVSAVRDKYNFNSEWLLYVGDIPEAKEVRFQDTDWKKVTLPRPFNEDEAFRRCSSFPGRPHDTCCSADRGPRLHSAPRRL